MKEILQNKLLIIFLIVFILIGTICSSVYAVDLNHNGTVYSVPEYNHLLDSNNYFMFLNKFKDVFLLVSYGEKNIFVDTLKDNVIVGYNYKVYRIDKDKNSWFLFTEAPDDGGQYKPTDIFYLFFNTMDIYKANWIDFVGYEFTDEVVFQGAPQKVELVQAMKVEEIPQKITQIIMIILPIFLLIFGTLLVIYLIRSKNLFQI